MTTAFIGDVHGCLRATREVVGKAERTASRIVFLGDYVDRGPNSRLVLDELIAIKHAFPDRTVFLRGNHDIAFLKVLQTDDETDTFLRMGGAKTIRSYLDAPYIDAIDRLRQVVPQAHREFLAALDPIYSSEDVLAVHDLRQAPNDGRYVVAGHATQADLVPTIGDHTALIDTGCGTRIGGRLTCMVWPTLEWWQSSDWSSEDRQDIC